MATSQFEPNVCSICLEECKQPQSLPCDHIFCKFCLQNYIDKSTDSGQKESFFCPICRSETRHDFVVRKESFSKVRMTENTCDVCKDIGKTKSATVVCEICEEFLCGDCETCHRSMKVSRSHKLRNLTVTHETEIDIYHCQSHQNEPYTTFCENHLQLCCKLCQEENHRFCQPVSSLKQKTLGAEIVNGISALLAELRIYDADVSQLAEERKHSLQELEGKRKKIRHDIESFKRKILAQVALTLSRQLPMLEIPLQESIDDTTSDISFCSTIRGKLDSVALFLEDIQRTGSAEDNFISFHVVKEKIEQFRQDIVSRHLDMKRNTFEFELTDFCQKFVNNSESLVKRHMNISHTHYDLPLHIKTMSERTLTLCSEIKVRLTSETKDCWIRSVVPMPNGQVLVLDKGNNSLKLFQGSGSLIDCQKISSSGETCSKIDTRTVVVTHSDCNLCVYDVDKKITLRMQKSIPQYALATVSVDDDAFISSFLTDLKVLDNQGELIQYVMTNNSGQSLFTKCRFLATNEDKTQVCVSDFDQNSVSVFSLHGRKVETTPVFVYKHKSLQTPNGITITRQGPMFVCGLNSNNIHLISKEGRLLKTFPISKPLALSLNEESMTLITSSLDDIKRNYIQIYKLM